MACITQSFVVCVPAPALNRRQRCAARINRGEAHKSTDAAVSNSPMAEESPLFVVSPSPSFLLVSLDEESKFFCYSSAEIVEDCSVIFDTCVSIRFSKSLPSFARHSATNGSFQLQDLEKNALGSWRAKVLALSSQNDPATPYVSTLPDKTAEPLLSLSVIVENDAKNIESQPLLLSYLKCLLVGTFILWEENKIHSVIHLKALERKFSLRIVSLLVSSQSTRNQASQRLVYRIMPSTKITISFDALLLKKKSNVNSTSTAFPKQQQPISTTTRYLIDTLHCLLQARLSSLPSTSLLRFVLLSGPPGTGKTFAVKSTVQAIPSCELVALQGSQIMSTGHVGEAIRRLQTSFQSAVKRPCPTLIFLDEFDALVASSSLQAMSTALGALMDKISQSDETEQGCVMLVAATNRVDVVPAALRRRFDHEIIMTPSTAEERLEILENLLQEAVDVDATEMPSPEDLLELSRDCVGCVPSDLAAIVRKASLALIQDPSLPILDHLRCASMIAGASALRDAAMQAPPRTQWDDIAGDAGGAKKALRQAIEWPRTRKAAYDALRLIPPRGILLHGPPGCAKTTAARAAAGAAGVAFLALGPADVYASSFVGDAEAVIRRAFTLARAASPCILFFDEIDSIIGAPNENSMNMARGSSAEARVLSTFLNEMDGVDQSPVDGVLVLGATNRPWTLDAALLRPGRLDKIIYVPPPDREARRALLHRQTNGWPFSVSEDSLDLDRLADISESMTGAEIVGACREAARLALRHHSIGDKGFTLDKQLLEDALARVKPLLQDETLLEQYRRFEVVHKR